MENFTEKQQKILSDLQILGTGAQAFFQDALELFDNGSIRTKQHLISHLMREIESSLREILRVIFPTNLDLKKVDQNQKHKFEIKQCLYLLNISEDELDAKFWLELGEQNGDYNLAKLAHRDNLDYRRISNDFVLHWKRFENFLERILNRIKSVYFNFINQIDQLIQIQTPQKKDIDYLTKILPKTGQFYFYFFNHLNSVDWFDPLFNYRYLQVSQDYIETNSNSCNFHWPPLAYLRTLCAVEEIDKVWKVIESLPESDSIGYHLEITKLVLLLPEDYQGNWLDHELGWIIKLRFEELLDPEPYRNLLLNLYKSKPKEVLDFLESMIALESRTEEIEVYAITPNPKAKIPKYEYFELVRALVSKNQSLELESRWRLFQVLAKALETSLGIEYPKAENGEDASHITRPSIPDDSQNSNHHFSDEFIPILRDLGCEMIESGSKYYDQVQDYLKSSRWRLFKRLYLFFARIYGLKLDLEGSKKILWEEDGKYIKDPSYRNEFYSFLGSCYPLLEDNEKKNFIDFLSNVANLQWERRKHLPTTLDNSPDDTIPFIFNNKEVDTELVWIYLSSISKYLEPDWKKAFDDLNSKFSNSDYPPQYATYHWSFVGPLSPLDQTDIANMKLEALVEYLKSYKSEESRKGHSEEGLSRELTKDVESNPMKYLESIVMLLNSNLSIRYHSSILLGFRDALSNRKTINYEKLVSYLNQLNQLFESGEANTQGKSNFRYAVLEIYRVLFGQYDIFKKSIENNAIIQNIFSYLQDDSPDEHYDRVNDDPIFTGINSIRGKTLHAIFQCLIWMIVENGKIDENYFVGSIVLEIIDKIKFHFTESKYRDFHTDRSVLGQYIRYLYLINSGWFHENISWILPSERKEVLDVTFHSFIKLGGFDSRLYSELKQYYYEMVEGLDDLFQNPNSEKGVRPFNIADHIMLIYGFGLEDLNSEGIVDLFFKKAPDFLKGNAIRFIGTKIPNDEKFIESAKSLWQWRVDSGSLSVRELSEFMEWWNSEKFDASWIFSFLHLYKTQANELRKLLGFRIGKVFDFLDENFENNPNLVLEIIDAYSNTNEFYLAPNKSGSLWSILKKGLAESIPQIKQRTEDIVHKLGSFGHLSYRELLGL